MLGFSAFFVIRLLKQLFATSLILLLDVALANAFENDTDRPGNDIRDFSAPTAESCNAACTQDGDCYAWTFVQGPNPWCYLKRPVPAAFKNTCCISGRKQEGVAFRMTDNQDRPGSDFFSFPITKTIPQLCKQACINNVRCRAWTYVRPGVQGPDPVCYLKDPSPTPVSNACCISGEQIGPTIGGHEVVRSPWATVGPGGSVGEQFATCPAGKFAIGAGYKLEPLNMLPAPEVLMVLRGLEIKGATLAGRDARIRVRNAHWTQPARIQAIASCIREGIQVTTKDASPTGSNDLTLHALCDAAQLDSEGNHLREQILGGGVWVNIDHHIDSNSPSDVGSSWRLATRQVTIAYPATVRAICSGGITPRAYEVISNPHTVVVPSQGTAGMTITCPGNKTALSAGVWGYGPDIALLTSSLEPTGDRSTWTANVLNRSVAFGDSVTAKMVAICVPTN